MNRNERAIPLSQAVRKRNESMELAPDQLALLICMQEEAVAGSSKPERPSRSPRSRRLALVAVLSGIAGMLLALFFNGQVQPGLGANPMIARIADEVGENHLNLKPMELESGALEDIRGYFGKLDFRPVETRLPAVSDARTLGGRYCSIDGNIATQLRMRDAKGGLRTLYQARYDPERFGSIPSLDRGEAPVEHMARGVPVKIWVEMGLLFALTGH